MPKLKSTVVLLLLLTACSPQNNNAVRIDSLQSKVNDLQHKLDDTYRPGFGEFMSSVQVHHAKLWFAGQNENWKLADFEIKEIKESLEDIQKYCTDRTETQSIPMIYPGLDSVAHSIGHKSKESFKSSFIFLTQTCNSCHQATQHEFNVVKIPDTPPFNNQVFKK